MEKIVLLVICFASAQAYFTLPGKCPENVRLQEDFRLANFYGTWYQTHHYSSDGRQRNNCSSIQLVTNDDGVYANLSRIDSKYFGRYSVGKIDNPTNIEDQARLGITFTEPNAPRRLVTRKYPFWILATNQNYAVIYTCQHSPAIDKHYIYIWVLSRSKSLNPVSLQLATDAIEKSPRVKPEELTKDDLSQDNCKLKYFEYNSVQPTTFRYPVPM